MLQITNKILLIQICGGRFTFQNVCQMTCVKIKSNKNRLCYKVVQSLEIIDNEVIILSGTKWNIN